MKHEVIMCIVNSGFSDVVMDVAREKGATGGTIINARGTANSETEKLFNITIHPEKEIIIIVVPKSIKDTLLHALYQEIGIKTEMQGIIFTLPVNDIVGVGEKG